MYLGKIRMIHIALLILVLGGVRVSTAQSLTSFADELRSHNISTTEPELIKALRNSDAGVRSAAAGQLAENHAVDALPQITQSLNVEKDPQVRVNMAAAISELGGQEGAAALEQVCTNATTDGSVALDAARHLAALKTDGECLKSVLSLIKESKDQGIVLQALSVVPLYSSKTSNTNGTMIEAVAGKLGDPTPAVRMAASQALVEIGDKSSINDLKSAISAEQVPDVRSILEQDLSKLQQGSHE